MDLNKTCPDCGGTNLYEEAADAHYCPACDKWLEEKCGDEECEYCWGRPPKPSDCQPVSEMGSQYLDRKL